MEPSCIHELTGYPFSLSPPFLINYSTIDSSIQITNLNTHQSCQIKVPLPVMQLQSNYADSLSIISKDVECVRVYNLNESLAVHNKFTSSLPNDTIILGFDNTGTYMISIV
jgi:hypothetical protein